jgi:hypothetical protein
MSQKRLSLKDQMKTRKAKWMPVGHYIECIDDNVPDLIVDWPNNEKACLFALEIAEILNSASDDIAP